MIYLYPANIYLFNVNNRNSRKGCKICSKLINKLKLTLKTIERSLWRRPSGFIFNFEHNSNFFRVFLLLTCGTSKCFLGKILIHIVLQMSFYWYDINSEERLNQIIGVLTILWIFIDKNVSTFAKPRENLKRFSLAISAITFTLIFFFVKGEPKQILHAKFIFSKYHMKDLVLCSDTNHVLLSMEIESPICCCQKDAICGIKLLSISKRAINPITIYLF